MAWLKFFMLCSVWLVVATARDRAKQWLGHEVHFSTMDDSMVEDAIQAAKDGDKGHQRHFLRLLKPTPERLAKLGGDKYVQSRTFQAMGEMDAYCEGYFRAKYGGRWRCRIFQGDYHGTPMMQLGTPSLCLRRLLEMTGNDGLHTAMSQAPPTFGQPL